MLQFLAGCALALLFAYAMSWLGVWLGQLVPTVEVANQVAFTTIFPITFLSNIFVPSDTLPAVLQPIAEWNPVSNLTAALREPFGNPTAAPSGSFPSEHAVILTVGWAVLMVAVFAPLATRSYRTTSR